MEIHNISELKNGWIVGNFEPSLFKNPHVEVAHHKHLKGYVGEKHTHKKSIELTYIVSGELIASGFHLSSGDIFIYHPNDIAEVEFLDDTDLLVIKWPSVSGDKYLL